VVTRRRPGSARERQQGHEQRSDAKAPAHRQQYDTPGYGTATTAGAEAVTVTI
jgi:hypothetical protein